MSNNSSLKLEEHLSLVEKRQELEESLKELDQQIYNYEDSYLKDSTYGNVVVGWSDPGIQPQIVSDEHRIFSQSSTWNELPHIPKPPRVSPRKRKLKKMPKQ
eukprot:m.110805 g.110805  ORF g.110805 m.110805 type:complete len:102 (+) comp9227_c1_seq1:239-544(+)